MDHVKTLSTDKGFVSIIFKDKDNLGYVHYLNPFFPGIEIPEEDLDELEQITNGWCGLRNIEIEKQG